MTQNIQEEVEDKVIDFITALSGGRLIIFKPENSDKDLIVAKKSDYKNSVIFLNIYWKNDSGAPDFSEEIKQLSESANLKPEENFYLLFVDFNVVKQDIEDNFLAIQAMSLKEIVKKGNAREFLTDKKRFVSFLIEASKT